jgi:hypothetical protein
VTARANLEWGYKPANYSQNAENPRLAMLIWLVVSTMNFIFHHILGIMIPTDFHIFQKGGSTTNQLCMFMESLFAIQKILLKMTPLTVAFFFQDTWLKQESVRSYPEKHR